MKTEKRKEMPCFNYKKSSVLDKSMTPERMKRKKIFQSTTNPYGTRLLDSLPDNADENANGTQISVQGRTEEQSNVSGNEYVLSQTMTNEELNIHIHKCLEMSSENKITPKNAFALQLIDCMKLLLNKEDFSVMACTLDAGQKIYAYRIDALHQQVIKLADEVIHSHNKKGENIDGEEEDEEKLIKDKRKSNKKHILASSESLNRKLKSKDPRDKFIKISGLPGSIMSSARRDPYDLSFTLEKSTPFWHDWENDKPLKAEGKVQIPQCKIFRDNNDITRKNNNLFDPPQIEAKTETADNSASDINVLEEELCSQITDGLHLSDTDSNAEKEYSDEEKSNMEEVDIILRAKARLEEETVEESEKMFSLSRFQTMRIIFNQVSDYDYLNKENAHYWAGPDFWKRPKYLAINCGESKKIKRKKKTPNPIIYNNLSLEEKINKNLKSGPPPNRKRIIAWKTKKVTYPNDLKVTVEQFLDLFHMSGMNEPENTLLSSKSDLPLADVQEHSESPLNSFCCEGDSPLNSCYDGGPENSGSPCPCNSPTSASNDIGLTHTPEKATDIGKILKVQFSCNCSQETSLIEAPKIIKFIPIKYKTRPIRVNMQNLKETMWGVINEEIDKNKHDMREPLQSNGGTLPETTFSSVLRKLPHRLEKATAEDLSPAMALLALLTLANENNLQLKNCEEYSDVVISHENSSL